MLHRALTDRKRLSDVYSSRSRRVDDMEWILSVFDFASKLKRLVG